MEAIRNYLETMFLNLPNTQEVYRAKSELLQMMEDKYTELKEEGKSENEAVGTVISEFGNLDELAEDLGIAQFVNQPEVTLGKTLSLEEAKNYVADYTKHAFHVALGVFLCIMAVTAPALLDSLPFGASDAIDALSGASFFIFIACGVALFIYSNIMMNKWDYLKHEPHVTDFATTQWLNQGLENNKSSYAAQLTIGVSLLILSVVPAILLDAISSHISLAILDNGGALFLFFVAAGVFLIVSANMRKASYTNLLSLNRAQTVGGNYVNAQKEKTYKNKTVNAIMSVFWPTATCLYLSWSFLSFSWHITWIVWPIAAILHTLLENLFSEEV